MHNLDQLAAQTAQTIVDRASNADALDILATKTLGVLQENGVYACVLFLDSRTSAGEKELAGQIRDRLHELLDAALGPIQHNDEPRSAQQAGSSRARQERNSARTANDALRGRIADHVANDLDTLLLVKQLWEQTLIYVRYGAKAKSAQQAAGRSMPGESTQASP